MPKNLGTVLEVSSADPSGANMIESKQKRPAPPSAVGKSLSVVVAHDEAGGPAAGSGRPSAS